MHPTHTQSRRDLRCGVSKNPMRPTQLLSEWRPSVAVPSRRARIANPDITPGRDHRSVSSA